MKKPLSMIARGSLILLASCVAEGSLVLHDNDDHSIPEPVEYERGEAIWSDGAYHMSIYQLKKPLDLVWIATQIGALSPSEATNINTLDEVPDSTWFTNRHAYRPLSSRELARGPGYGEPSGPWTVVKGKDLGVNPGFVATDTNGRLLFVKFDPPEYPGLGTNADVVASRILHAAGYFVPSYYAVAIDPEDIRLSPDATIPGRYRVKRAMTPHDLESILSRAPLLPDGRVLANVSVGLPGVPKGPFEYQGVRADDPNDTVRHEDRRELRGLRLFMAWLNNHDARRGNTLDMYVEDKGRRFLRHFLIDFSASLGSSNIAPKDPFEGHEYWVDPAIVGQSLGALGLWIKPWELDSTIVSPAIGHFDARAFDPEAWRGSYANPAFDRMTERDGFWAAKIIASFSDEDLRAIVSAGAYANDEANYVVRVLAERRDLIRDRWLNGEHLSPLSDFRVQHGDGGRFLTFRDLRRDQEAGSASYHVRIGENPERTIRDAKIHLDRHTRGTISIRAEQANGALGPEVVVTLEDFGDGIQVARVER